MLRIVLVVTLSFIRLIPGQHSHFFSACAAQPFLRVLIYSRKPDLWKRKWYSLLGRMTVKMECFKFRVIPFSDRIFNSVLVDSTSSNLTD